MALVQSLAFGLGFGAQQGLQRGQSDSYSNWYGGQQDRGQRTGELVPMGATTFAYNKSVVSDGFAKTTFDEWRRAKTAKIKAPQTLVAELQADVDEWLPKL